MDQLTQTVMTHEGFEAFAYKDTTGHLTIGYGRNLTNNGISPAEAAFMLQNDLAAARVSLSQMPYFVNQDYIRQGALVELAFNMGMDGLETFVHFLDAMTAADYQYAVNDLKNSLWANQVHPERVNNICYRVLNGSYPET